jgi:hypothetical protein
MGFRVPSALSVSQVHLSRVCTCPLWSAFRVCLPSWRFAPCKPCRFCFAPAALLGFTLRSLLLPKGIRRVSATDEPTYRFTRRYTSEPEDAVAGPAGLGFWVLTLPGIPGARWSFNPASAGCSLGFFPSRALGNDLDQDFARSPLTRFSGTAGLPPLHLRLRVRSVSAPPVLRLRQAAAVRRSSPYRVFAPVIPDHSDACKPGLWVHLAQREPLLITLTCAL